MPRESKRTQIDDEKTRESKRAQREDEKTREYKRVQPSGRTALPQHRISQIDAERMQELTGNINPMLLQRSEPAVREIIKQYIKALTDDCSVLTRIGAYTYLFSQIENRLRSMYRQRYAVMMGKRVPRPAAENLDPTSETLLDPTIETHDLLKVIKRLREYDDIAEETAQDAVALTTIRNKLIHQAVYRIDAFRVDLLPPLIEMYVHMVRVRKGMSARVKKDRKLYFADTQGAVTARTSHLSIGETISREALFALLGGSVSLVAPIVNRQPLYFVVRHEKNLDTLTVSLGEEMGHHPLWQEIIKANRTYRIFKKKLVGHVAAVTFLGIGRISELNQDQKTLTIELVGKG
jgi:hypothetical protein